jgi:hypothetical protein
MKNKFPYEIGSFQKITASIEFLVLLFDLKYETEIN